VNDNRLKITIILFLRSRSQASVRAPGQEKGAVFDFCREFVVPLTFVDWSISINNCGIRIAVGAAFYACLFQGLKEQILLANDNHLQSQL